VLLAVALTGCAGAAADHERLGDAAYAEGEFPSALEEYQAAAASRNDARLWAKVGAAAFRSEEYRAAVDAYQKLAAADPTRAVEAARGLEQVVRAADRAENGAALEDAVEALRRLAPERVSSRHTLALVKSGRLAETEEVGMGPLALAAAGDAATTDQLLLRYAEALRQTTACAEAADAYAAVLRRSRDGALRQRATRGLSDCATRLGLEALLLDRPEIASRWFNQVLDADSTSPLGRRALVGLGDARVKLGDLLGATLAYQDAMRGDPADTISTLAAQRLARLGASAATADSL
jgi:tetratricopeptide (TPR) repeat protein